MFSPIFFTGTAAVAVAATNNMSGGALTATNSLAIGLPVNHSQVAPSTSITLSGETKAQVLGGSTNQDTNTKLRTNTNGSTTKKPTVPLPKISKAKDTFFI